MTSVENPLTKRIQVAFQKYLGPFGIAETLPKQECYKHRNPGRSGKVPGRETGRQKPYQKPYSIQPAVREGPGRFREGKREGRNRLVKTPQSGKVREGSGKVTGKGKRTVQTTFLGVSVRYFQKRYQKGPETWERCKYH